MGPTVPCLPCALLTHSPFYYREISPAHHSIIILTHLPSWGAPHPHTPSTSEPYVIMYAAVLKASHSSNRCPKLMRSNGRAKDQTCCFLSIPESRFDTTLPFLTHRRIKDSSPRDCVHWGFTQCLTRRDHGFMLCR